VDETGVRAALQHYLDHSAQREEDVAHEIYADDAVLEWPQGGERVRGKAYGDHPTIVIGIMRFRD
jgi:hypothetical protein